MHVPLLLIGPGVAAGAVETPVSTRRIFHTVLDWAGLGAANSLRADAPEVVLGEAMKPFLAYGWLPQVMAVEGRHKAIRAGTLEVYDVAADPRETRDLAASAGLSRALRNALLDYPIPSLEATTPTEALGEEERRQLASLGYVSAAAPPGVRPDAPRPVEMARLFDLLEKASGLFVREEYAAAIPLLQRILAGDPHNLDAALRLATAHSALGQDARAVAAFEKARAIAPRSDGRPNLPRAALRARRGVAAGGAAARADRRRVAGPAARAGGAGRRSAQRQGRIEDAIGLRQRIHALRDPSAAELVALARAGHAARGGPPSPSMPSRRRARLQGAAFAHDLELGVLYLAARRFAEARDALDRVPPSHPGLPDGALQARAGERAAAGARPGGADRARRVSGRMRPPAR